MFVNFLRLTTQLDMFWSTLAIVNNKWILTQPLIQRKSRASMQVPLLQLTRTTCVEYKQLIQRKRRNQFPGLELHVDKIEVRPLWVNRAQFQIGKTARQLLTSDTSRYSSTTRVVSIKM